MTVKLDFPEEFFISRNCPDFITASSVKVRSIVISVSVCLSVSISVCLSICPLTYLENHTFGCHQIICTCCLWPWPGPSLAALQ